MCTEFNTIKVGTVFTCGPDESMFKWLQGGGPLDKNSLVQELWNSCHLFASHIEHILDIQKYIRIVWLIINSDVI